MNSWCLKTQLADSGTINFIDWSRDGTKFVTGTQTGRVVVYDARTLDQLHVYSGFGAAINVVRFSRNSQLIGIGGASANIRIMRISDWSIIGNYATTGQGSIVYQLDFSHDDAYMITCGNSNFLKLYTLSVSATAATITEIDVSTDVGQKIISCQCSPSAYEVGFGGFSGNGYHLKWKAGGTNRFNPGNNPTVLPFITSGSLRRGIDYNEITGTVNLVGSDLHLEIWNPNGGGTTTKINIGKNMNNVNIAKDGTYAAIVGASGAT